jgi:hypothetical protein
LFIDQLVVCVYFVKITFCKRFLFGFNTNYMELIMIFNKILLLALVVATISGCDSSSISPEIPATTTLSGKVADGYLRGANVCLDLNKNKICDPGEPSATSTAGGVLSHYCCI